MRTELVFQNRDFSPRLDRKDLKFTVNSYSYEAIGGCKEMSVTATGGELVLWDLINWLRFPVVKYNKVGSPVWWGYVHQVAVRQGALEVAASLDSMTNRVAVAYSYVAPGTQTVGTRKTTAWVDKAESQAEFGVKELLSSAAGLSDAGATARLNAILAAQAWPQGGVTVNSSGMPRGRVRYSGAKKSLSATVTCKGWWQTLGWKYANVQPSTLIDGSYAATPGTQNMGSAAGNTKMMQQVVVGSSKAINALGAKVYIYKVGAPTDNVVVEIYGLDTSGLPTGSAMASGTLSGVSLQLTNTWTAIPFSTGINLAAYQKYGLVVRRSGANDGSNYYTLRVDTGLGYTDGFAKLWNGSSWVNPSPNCDLSFQLYLDNNVDSALQIADAVNAFGQFLTATDLEGYSGVLLSSYRNGTEATALQVVTDLMAVGGPNGRRQLSWVDINRRVQIFEEPALTTSPAYYMDSQGNVSGLGGIPIDNTMPPVGAWMRMKDLLPGVVDLTKLVDPSLQFIEESSWSNSGGDTYRYKGQPSIESVLTFDRAY